MASTLDHTGSKNIWKRLGSIFYAQQEILNRRSTKQSRRTTVASFFNATEYDSIGDLLDETGEDAAYEAELRSLQQQAATELIRYVNAGIPLPAKTVYEAVKALIKDMNDGSHSVDGNTVALSATTAASGNTGNGTVISDLTDVEGYNMQYLPAGKIDIECLEDTQYALGGGSAGDAFFQISGKAAIDGMSVLWPGGLGFTPGSLAKYIDTVGSMDQFPDGGPGRNILANSDFDTNTGDTPSKWANASGTAGTDYTKDNSDVVRTGGQALKFISTSVAGIKQSLNVNDGTGSGGKLAKKKRYILGGYVKKTGAPSTGTFRASIKDPSGPTILDSSAAAFTIAVGSLTTSYALQTAKFTSPLNIPSGGVQAFAELTAALDTGTIKADGLFLAEMIAVVGLPNLCIVRGSTPFVKGDKITLTYTNDWAGTFQYWFERNFGMRSMGLCLPYNLAGAETIDDALVA